MMEVEVDYFAVLGQEHRAELDIAAIRDEFQRLSRECHPDAGGELQAFETLNQAHSVISDPVSRLRHLYELEFGQFPPSSGGFSHQALGLFETVGAAVAGAAAFFQRSSSATTAIARALIARDEQGVQRAVIDACGKVRSRRDELLLSLPEVDRRLVADREAARAFVEDLCRELAFLAKWERQLNESMAGFL